MVKQSLFVLLVGLLILCMIWIFTDLNSSSLELEAGVVGSTSAKQLIAVDVERPADHPGSISMEVVPDEHSVPVESFHRLENPPRLGYVFRGRVLDRETLEPVPGVRIRISDSSWTDSVCFADSGDVNEAGEFEFESILAERLYVTFEHWLYAGAEVREPGIGVSYGMTLELNRHELRSDVEVVLTRKECVRVRLLNQDGSPAREARLDFAAAFGNVECRGNLWTDDEGWFQLDCAALEIDAYGNRSAYAEFPYQVDLSVRPWGSGQVEARGTISRVGECVDLGEYRVSAGRRVRGQVRYADQDPVMEQSVYFVPEECVYALNRSVFLADLRDEFPVGIRDRRPSYWRVVTDGEGRFCLEGLPESGGYLLVSRDGFLPVVQKVDRVDQDRLITLDKGITTSGTVRTAEGQGVGNVELIATCPVNFDGCQFVFPLYIKSRADGLFICHGVPVGGMTFSLGEGKNEEPNRYYEDPGSEPHFFRAGDSAGELIVYEKRAVAFRFFDDEIGQEFEPEGARISYSTRVGLGGKTRAYRLPLPRSGALYFQPGPVELSVDAYHYQSVQMVCDIEDGPEAQVVVVRMATKPSRFDVERR